MTSLPVLPPEAATELLARRQARRSLLHFTTYTYPKYTAEPAHVAIADAVQGAIETPGSRLMIFAPPQHGKSEIVSVRAPAWAIGRKPDSPVILASYGAALAESKSRQVREIVESAEFGRVFPDVRTNPESRAVNNWGVAGTRGGMMAVGVGGPVTGHGTPLAIIDDPVENWEQAYSETYRNRIWDWYRGTFRTRVWEGGSIILIMTRWHEDDLAGRIVGADVGEWRVIRLPAIAESQSERDMANARLGLPVGQGDPIGRDVGAPLCPCRFSRKALDQLRHDVGTMAWSAEYQGVPTPMSGNLAKREWFPIVDAAPAQARKVRFWDFAATVAEVKGSDPDYTVGALVSESGGLFYVEHVIRGRFGPGAVEDVVMQTAQSDGKAVPIHFEQEPGSGGKLFTSAMIRALAGWPVRAMPSRGDKVTRAMPFLSQAEAGNVRLVRGAWCSDWLDEMVAFPAGAHDDQVDATAAAFAEVVPLGDLVASVSTGRIDW